MTAHVRLKRDQKALGQGAEGEVGREERACGTNFAAHGHSPCRLCHIVPGQLGALPSSRFADFQALVCDEPNPVCDDCVPTYPPTEGLGLIAGMTCVDQHCVATPMIIEPN